MKNKILRLYHYISKKTATFSLFKHNICCSACHNYVSYFRNSGVKSPVFKKLAIIGGGYRNGVTCPVCGSNDRVRWIDYVISNFTDIYNKNLTILHIAPEPIVENKIRNKNKDLYITGDILPGRADCVVDITNMQFDSKKFDYIILNHVMEHIPDELRAVNEIKRCLKQSGKVILSFPVSLRVKTFQNKNVKSNKERLIRYGQKDHCRLYGYDVVEYFKKMGIFMEEFNVSLLLNNEEIRILRFTPQDRVYIGSLNRF